MTPPRDPDSGRGRAPRTPRARTDAGELDRTIDELTPVEAWHRLEDRIGKAEARVSVCETEREHRGKWTKIIRGVLASLGAAAVSALAWAVVKIGDAGEERADAKRRADDLRGAIEAVRALQLQMAADHALLIQHLSQPRQGP